ARPAKGHWSSAPSVVVVGGTLIGLGLPEHHGPWQGAWPGAWPGAGGPSGHCGHGGPDRTSSGLSAASAGAVSIERSWTRDPEAGGDCGVPGGTAEPWLGMLT